MTNSILIAQLIIGKQGGPLVGCWGSVIGAFGTAHYEQSKKEILNCAQRLKEKFPKANKICIVKVSNHPIITKLYEEMKEYGTPDEFLSAPLPFKEVAEIHNFLMEAETEFVEEIKF